MTEYEHYKNKCDQFANLLAIKPKEPIYMSFEDFPISYLGYDFVDENGNAISTFNPECKLDDYVVGGIYKGALVDKTGNYQSILLAKEIDWDACISKANFRAKRDWKEAHEEDINDDYMLEAVYGIKSNDNQSDYIFRRTYTFVDSLVDKDGNFHSIVCNNKNQWEEEFYNPFIKDLNDEDVLILVDCEK